MEKENLENNSLKEDINNKKQNNITSFYVSRIRINKKRKPIQISNENFDNTLRYYFPITNRTYDNNFYTNHGKTMSKFTKFEHNKKNKIFEINKISYAKNLKLNRFSFPKIKNIISNFKLTCSNKSKFNENKRYMGPKTKPKKEKNLFPLFDYLNPELKDDYYSLIKKENRSLLFIKDNHLNVDDEIEKLNCSNYITDNLIKGKKDNKERLILSYDDYKETITDLPFLEKKITYGALSSVRFKFKNPVHKAKVYNLLNNINQMSSIHRLKIINEKL